MLTCEAICTVAGCGRSKRSSGAGYCERHYMRMRRPRRVVMVHEAKAVQGDGGGRHPWNYADPVTDRQAENCAYGLQAR